LQWGIKWGIVRRMMEDAPQYHYDTGDSKSKPKSFKQAQELTKDNAKDIMEYFNKLNGVK